MSSWTDELKEQVIEMYKKAEPTPESLSLIHISEPTRPY